MFNINHLAAHRQSSQNWLNQNGNGTVGNLQQYTNAFVNGGLGDANTAQAVFNNIDQNNDGNIDLPEIIANIFAADQNNDGNIPRAELDTYVQQVAANNAAMLSRLGAALSFTIQGLNNTQKAAQDVMSDMINKFDNQIDQAEQKLRNIINPHQSNNSGINFHNKEFNLTQAEKDAIMAPVNNLATNASPQEVEAAIAASMQQLQAAGNRRNAVNTQVPSDRNNPNGSSSSGYRNTYNQMVQNRGRDDLGMSGLIAWSGVDRGDDRDWIAFNFTFQAGADPKVNVDVASSTRNGSGVVDDNTFDPNLYQDGGVGQLRRMYRDGVNEFQTLLSDFVGQDVNFEAGDIAFLNNASSADAFKAGMDALIAKYTAQFTDSDDSDGTTVTLNFDFKHPTVTVNGDIGGSSDLAATATAPEILVALRDAIREMDTATGGPGTFDFDPQADAAQLAIINDANASVDAQHQALIELADKYSAAFDSGAAWVDGPNGTKINKNLDFVLTPPVARQTNHTDWVNTSIDDPNATLSIIDNAINQLVDSDNRFNIFGQNNFPDAADNDALTAHITEVFEAYGSFEPQRIDDAIQGLVDFLNEKLDGLFDGRDVQLDYDPMFGQEPVTIPGSEVPLADNAEDTLTAMSQALAQIIGVPADDVNLNDGVMPGGSVTGQEAMQLSMQVQAVRNAYAAFEAGTGDIDGVNAALSTLVDSINTAYDIAGRRDVNLAFEPLAITNEEVSSVDSQPTSTESANETLTLLDQVIDQLLGPQAGAFNLGSNTNFQDPADNAQLTQLIDAVNLAYNTGDAAAINTSMGELVSFLNEKVDGLVGLDLNIEYTPLTEGEPNTVEGFLSKTGGDATDTLQGLSQAIQDVYGINLPADLDLDDGVVADGTVVTQEEADALNALIEDVRTAYDNINTPGGGYDGVNAALSALVGELNSVYDIGSQDIEIEFSPIRAGTAVYEDLGRLFDPNFSFDANREPYTLSPAGSFNGIDPTQAGWVDTLIQANPERYLAATQRDFNGDGNVDAVDTAVVAKLRTFHDAAMNPEYITLQMSQVGEGGNKIRPTFDANGKPTGAFREYLENDYGIDPDVVTQANTVNVYDEGNNDHQFWVLLDTKELLPKQDANGQLTGNTQFVDQYNPKGRDRINRDETNVPLDLFEVPPGENASMYKLLGVKHDAQGNPMFDPATGDPIFDTAGDVLGQAWVEGKTIQQLGESWVPYTIQNDDDMNQIQGLGNNAYFGRVTEANELELDNNLPHNFQYLRLNNDNNTLVKNPLWYNGTLFMSGGNNNRWAHANDAEWMVPTVNPGGFRASNTSPTLEPGGLSGSLSQEVVSGEVKGERIDTEYCPGWLSSILMEYYPGLLEYSAQHATKTPGEIKGDVTETTETVDITPGNPSHSHNRWNVITPLMLDINGAGIELTDIEDGVEFDLDADGEAEKVAWSAARGDDTAGFLTLDINGNGVVDNGAELFGSQHGDANGFERLRAFDSNGDGKISSADHVFSGLKVWQDKNHDGVSQADELVTLAQAGVESINLSYTESDEMDVHGNGLFQQGSFTRTQEKLAQLEALGRPADLLGFIMDAWLKSMK